MGDIMPLLCMPRLGIHFPVGIMSLLSSHLLQGNRAHLSRACWYILMGHQSRSIWILGSLPSQLAGSLAGSLSLAGPGQPHRALGAAKQTSHLPWHMPQPQPAPSNL